MGNNFSSPLLDAPVTFSGLSVTSELWKHWQEQRPEENKSNMFFLSDLLGWFDNLDKSDFTQAPQWRRQQCSVKRIRFVTFDCNGNLIPLDPTSFDSGHLNNKVRQCCLLSSFASLLCHIFAQKLEEGGLCTSQGEMNNYLFQIFKGVT
jgi:hypothetical protein